MPEQRIKLDEGETLLFEQTRNTLDKLVITKGMWRGAERINIRLYTLNREGLFVPTQKGVSIPINSFRGVQKAIAGIQLPGGDLSEEETES